MVAFGDFDDVQIGSISDVSIRIKDSFIAMEDMDFGVALSRDTTDGVSREKKVKKWFVDGVFVGVSAFSHTYANDFNTGVSQIKAGDSIDAVRFGRVDVLVSVDVLAGDKAYIDATTGLFTKVATNNILVGEFTTTAIANTKVKLWLK
jgi:hypothetical protein